MKLLIVIPAYNEEESLPLVLPGLAAVCPQYDIAVVSDGSTDHTVAVCRDAGVFCIELPVNLGLTGAFQTGLLYAKTHGYDAVLQFDADGQHLPQYVEPLAQKLQEGYDIVIGSRFVTVPKPKSLRMFGSYLISFAMRFTCRQRICDPTSGMRMYSHNMLREFAENLNYSPEPDTLSYLIHAGARVAEIQVEMAPRAAGHSYFNFVRSMRYMVEMAVSILLIQPFRKRQKTSLLPKGGPSI